MQSPAVQFVPSLVTEDDDEVEEDNVDDEKEVGDAEKKFHLSGGGSCTVNRASKQRSERANRLAQQRLIVDSGTLID